MVGFQKDNLKQAHLWYLYAREIIFPKNYISQYYAFILLQIHGKYQKNSD